MDYKNVEIGLQTEKDNDLQVSIADMIKRPESRIYRKFHPDPGNFVLETLERRYG